MKRKISYEQDQALARGRAKARDNQRRRTAANIAADKAAAQRAEDERNHVHGFKPWGENYILNYTHEVRECRDCGFAEIRPVRL